MHTREIDGYSFHYDNSLTGNVVIHNNLIGQGMAVTVEALLEFVGGMMISEQVGRLEDMSGREMLDAMLKVEQ
jgi:hypothetical protein